MRLIDADKLIGVLKSEYVSVLEKALLGIVEGQPTAYDVDRVVEQLRGLNENEFTYAKVMHIVKAGGVNEN